MIRRTQNRAMGSRLGYGVRGLGLWGYVALLLGVAVAVTLVLRIGPHYMNFRTVQTVIESLDSEPVHQLSKRQINELLVRRFKINSLYDLKPSDILSVNRAKEQTVLAVNYEVREPLFHNADVILHFEREFAFK